MPAYVYTVHVHVHTAVLGACVATWMVCSTCSDVWMKREKKRSMYVWESNDVSSSVVSDGSCVLVDAS